MNTTKTNREDLRVLQRNMIYCSGLPSNITHAELISEPYFGLYGKVEKLVKNPYLNRNYCSVYITYSHQFEAATAILACNEFQIERSTLWCLFGTMKYCKFFLKKIECKNYPNCPYLHIFDHKNEIEIQASPSEAFPEHEDLAKKVLLKHQNLIRKLKQDRKTGGRLPDPIYALEAIGEYEVEDSQQQEETKQRNETIQQSSNKQKQEKEPEQEIQVSFDNRIKKLILRQLDKANGSRVMKGISQQEINLRKVIVDGLTQ